MNNNSKFQVKHPLARKSRREHPPDQKGVPGSWLDILLLDGDRDGQHLGRVAGFGNYIHGVSAGRSDDGSSSTATRKAGKTGKDERNQRQND